MVTLQLCTWTLDDCSENAWETSCEHLFILDEHLFILDEDTPRENNMKYCCFCGRPLEQVIPDEPEDLEV